MTRSFLTQERARARSLALGLTLVATVFAGCSAEQIWIAEPTWPQHEAAIVVVEGGIANFGFATEASLLDFDAPAGWERPETFQLSVLLFAKKLEDLGVPPGLMAVDEERQVRCTALRPLTIFTTQVGETTSKWQELNDLPDSVRAFLLPAKPCLLSTCKTFTQTLLTFDAPHEPRTLHAIDEESVLVTGLDSSSRLTRTSAEEITFNLASRYQRTFMAADGNVWVGTSSGDVARGPLLGPLEVVHTGTTTLEEVRVIFGSNDPTVDETIVVWQRKLGGNQEMMRVRIHRFVGATEERVFWGDLPGRVNPAGCLWRGPGRFIVGLRSSAIILYENGTVRSMSLAEKIPSGLVQLEIVSLVETEAFGIVLGTRTGQLYYADNPAGAWNGPLSIALESSVAFLLPLAKGVLAINSGSIAQQFDEAGEACPKFAINGIEIGAAAVVGRGFVIAGEDSSDSAKKHAVWLEELE